MVYTLLFFSLQNAVCFINSNVFGSCIIRIIYTSCAKIKKIIPAPKVKGLVLLDLKKGLMCSPVKLGTNYQIMPLKIPKERRHRIYSG